MAALGPFRFEWGDYPARRFHPLAKLAALLALSVAAGVASAPWLAAPALAGAAALAAAGAFSPNLREGGAALLRDARFLLPLALFVAVFRVVDPWGAPVVRLGELPAAALYVARLVVVFACAEAFFRSTSAEELSASATAVARRLTRRGDIDPGLYLSLAVGFIPRCFDAYGRAREAALARGYGGRRGRRPRFRAALALLESFLASSVRGALATAEALEARGYSPSRSVASHPFRGRDLALCLAAAAAAAATVVFR